MPETIVVAAFVFGAVLLLIALLGGGFKLFGAEISGTTGHAGRGVAAILGASLLAFGIYRSTQPDRASQTAPTVTPITPAAPPTESGSRHNFAEALRGVWTSEDPNTGEITKLVILRKGTEIFVHAWGKCVPEDCDWGEVRGQIESDILKVTWYWTAGTRDMSIQLDGNRLRAGTIHVYTDRRPPRTWAQVFVRQA